MNLPDLTKADPKRMAAARRQIHTAAHWLARMANSFIPATAGHDHLKLRWTPERGALATQSFDGALAVELRLAQLQFQFLEDGKPVPHILDLEDRSPATIEAWMLVELLHRNKERDRFSKLLPYEIASPMTGDSEKYMPEELAPELALLTNWAKSATDIISPLAKGEQVWFWPEPMQFGFVAKTGAPASNGGSHVRTAFSLGDERTSEPHFLVVPEKHGSVQSLRPDVVLPASRIQKDALGTAAIQQFLSSAVSGAKG